MSLGRPARVLFVNEGELGEGDVMGHAAAEESLRARLSRSERIEARFANLSELRGLPLLATRSLPLLASYDLDFQPTRWHMVQSLRARRLVQRELARFRADALHVESHAVSFGLEPAMRRLPTFLSVDVTVTDWRLMGIWRPVRGQTERTLALSRALERRAFAAAALVLAWTAWVRASVERSLPGAAVEEHHPGIDLRVFRPAVRTEQKPVRVLFVGGRFAKKGGHDLLAALGGRLGRTVELDVVTPEAVPRHDGVRVHALGIGDPRLVELYRRADVFCLPSHGDAAPLAILEAMACEAAVVSTSVGAIPELLGHGSAGLVVPPRSPVLLAEALDELVEDPERRRELGRAARARCEECYDAVRQTDRLVELIESRL